MLLCLGMCVLVRMHGHGLEHGKTCRRLSVHCMRMWMLLLAVRLLVMHQLLPVLLLCILSVVLQVAVHKHLRVHGLQLRPMVGELVVLCS